MDPLLKDFAIITKSTEIELQSLVDDFKYDNNDSDNKILITAGNLIKIIQYDNDTKSAKIQIMDYTINKNIIWENLYKCPINNLKKIHDNLFPFLIAIQDPEERLQIVLRPERYQNILYMKYDDIVNASGEPFRKDIFYDCIIRYIGLVPEIGPGYYFGLELLHLENGCSPQAQFIPFVHKYMQCDPELSLILSANWIYRPNSQTLTGKKKFSTRELFCGTLERVQSALGLNTNDGNDNDSHRQIKKHKSIQRKLSLRKDNNKNHQIDLTSAVSSETNGSIESKNQATTANKNQILSKTVMDKKNHHHYQYHNFSSKSSNPYSVSNSKKDKATNTNFTQNKQENVNHKSTTEKDKDKREFSTQSDDLILLDNDEYSRYVEKYEHGLERLHIDTNEKQQQQQQQQPQQQIIPTSILKQSSSKNKKKIFSSSHSGSSGSSSSGCNNLSQVKPNTIMSLEDRDIVVIDRVDIKESVMNESEVIVVDNPRMQKEVDLVEILGTNWPSSAGDAAIVLNNIDTNKISGTGVGLGNGSSTNNSGHISSSSNSSASNYNIRCERNKSGNPISHLVSSKVTVDKRNKDILKSSFSDQSSFEGNKTVEKKIKNSDPIYDSPNINSSSQIVSITPSDDEIIQPSPLNEIPSSKLGVGSMVEVSTDVCEDLYGVIRWIGCPHGSKSIMVGVELEDDQEDRPLTLTDGSHNGKRFFKCPNGRALFVYPNQCSKDRRFLDIDVPHVNPSKVIKSVEPKMFGQVDCPPVPGAVAPLKIYNLEDLEAICGKFKGIQGHHNSCYLDATLFAMFTFTSVFDSLLFRPPEPEDILHYEEVQAVLREEIVNPLRKNIFVRADRVMKLRQLLEKLSSISGLTSEEKDPEEFLNSLLAQIMRAEPFLKLSSGQDAFFYQLFVEKDERLNFPSVQQLFEQSFLASDIKLKEVPSCLIIQMPRFGKNFKMYPRILPSQVLDVTDIIEDSPRQCSVCGKLAEFECRECFGILQCGVGLESTAFCKKCLETVHSHSKRANHIPKEISVPQDFKIMAEHLTVPRLFMELFAVVCIETSHYVAFVKAGSGLDAPWCFFDSMADRKGEQNGYNIPEMVSVPDLPQWLSEDGARVINETASNDKMLPEHAKRLLCDAYMCMYQSTDVMMYR